MRQVRIAGTATMPPDRPDGLRRRLVLAGAALPAACAAPSYTAPPSTAPASPRVAEGDRWRYVEVDGFKREKVADIECTVVAVSPLVRVRVADSSGRPRADEVYQSPWRVIEDPFYDQPQTFATALPLVPSPPAAGAIDRQETTYRVSGSSDVLRWQAWLEAPGWQRIRVPAGEYDCLVIERRIWFRHSDYFRQDARRTDRLWYAPAVNRWVRREWNGDYLMYGESLFSPMAPRMREDWRIWELTDHVASSRR